MSVTRNELAALALKLVIGGVFLLGGIDSLMRGDQLSEWGPVTGCAVGFLVLMVQDARTTFFAEQSGLTDIMDHSLLLLASTIWLTTGIWFLTVQNVTDEFVYASLVTGASGLVAVAYNVTVNHRQASAH